MGTWYVSGDGNDANAGSTAAPFRTVAKAYASAVAGDTIRMRTGRYVESLQLEKQNLTFIKDRPEDVPVMDGNSPLGALANAIWGYINATVEGIEVVNYTGNGLFFQGAFKAGQSIVRKCRIHDIYSYATNAIHQRGVCLTWGADSIVEDNVIYNVGYGGEARGVFLLECDRPVCRRNVIFGTTKEGIRDYRCRDAKVYDNNIFACWTGLAMNANIGGDYYNNFLHDCPQGINPKHCNYTGSQSFWGDTAEKWTRIHHNTTQDNNDCAIAIGVNTVNSTVPTDISRVSIRNNVWRGRGWTRIFDFPNIVEVPGTIIVDNNRYEDSPRYVYRKNYDPSTVYYATLAELQANTGFEQHAGVPFDSPLLGLQMGAAGYVESPWEYVDYPAAPVAAKATPQFGADWLPVSDGYVWTYRLTRTSLDEWVVFDLGTARPFNVVMESPYMHPDQRNIKGYRIESGDSSAGPWTVLAEGEINDPEGAQRQIKVPETTARYVRFMARSAFGGAYFVFAEFRIGRFRSSVVEPALPPALPLTAVEVEGAAA